MNVSTRREDGQTVVEVRLADDELVQHELNPRRILEEVRQIMARKIAEQVIRNLKPVLIEALKGIE